MGQSQPPVTSNNNNNQFSDVTEFINDVYVYGKLYADISADIDFGDTVTFQNVVINNSLINSTFDSGPVDLDYLTVKQRLDVGVSGTVFTPYQPQMDIMDKDRLVVV